MHEPGVFTRRNAVASPLLVEYMAVAILAFATRVAEHQLNLVTVGELIRFPHHMLCLAECISCVT